jgi:hypothetical protein
MAKSIVGKHFRDLRANLLQPLCNKGYRDSSSLEEPVPSIVAE